MLDLVGGAFSRAGAGLGHQLSWSDAFWSTVSLNTASQSDLVTKPRGAGCVVLSGLTCFGRKCQASRAAVSTLFIPEAWVQVSWACQTHRAAPSYFCLATALPSQLSTCLPEVNFQKQESPEPGRGMNREGAPGKSPEEMYIQQKVRVLLMLRKMGSNLTASEEEFLRTYAGVVNSQLSQLPPHSIDQGTVTVRR
ncbi:PREDICTED: beta-catenin-interacting protein 1 isoform X2 [Cercocebus atys]|uniref:beta-catenin-interacting protein 1 isoform X2 n=1 Tax=Cercocebus atys TaxID=9531 RepID=UPI0005F4144B|nr:PREDICTED: beta-catenin-interacting protein 1 isoform X2 [Cercocebus atys]